jgi:hypothetical protein
MLSKNLPCATYPTMIAPGVTTSSANDDSPAVTSFLWLAHHASSRSIATPDMVGSTASWCLQQQQHHVSSSSILSSAAACQQQ